MWETDPAIRDFVGPALDYAYDYNTPGAAPGYGPLSESDIADAKRLLDRMFSRIEPGPAEAPESTVVSERGNESQELAEPAEQAERLAMLQCERLQKATLRQRLNPLKEV